MRCEEAQKELARNPVDAVMRDALASHVASCPACERVRRLYGRIDEVLVHGPVWAVPVEFGRRVAARVPRPAPRRIAARRMLPPGVLDVATPGLLIAAAGCIAGLAPDASIVDAVPLTWLCAALSLWIGASYTRLAIHVRDRLP